MMTTQKRNFILLWIRSAMTTAASTLSAASVLGGYLMWAGVEASKIAFYQSVVPLANTVISLLFAGVAARYQNTVKGWGVSCVAMGVLTALYSALFCLKGDAPAFYPILMVLGALLSVFTAIRNIFDYKMPCEVMDLADYSTYLSVSGIVGAVVSIGVSALAAYCYKAFDFHTVSVIAFAAAGVLFFTAALFNRFVVMITRRENDRKDEKKSGAFAVLRDRDFRILALPNFIRGVGEAVFAMLTVFAIADHIVIETDGQTITTFTQIANFISCTLYGVLTPRIKSPRVCILGAGLMTAFIPAFFAGRIGFFSLFTLAYIGYTIVGNALPNMIYEAVDPGIMSAFHTWRLAFMTAGNTVTTTVIGLVIGRIPNIVLVVTGVAAYAVCSLAYYLLFAKRIIKPKTADLLS